MLLNSFFKRISIAFIGICIVGCAQVPKESVELSATVGRDIAQVHKAHRDLAIIFYDRMKKDVNKFVDEVYAPYQIEKQLQAEYKEFKNGNPMSLLSILDEAVKHPDNSNYQKDTLDMMNIFVSVIQENIESFRNERLGPIIAQEKELLESIDYSYNQIHYANSIVTGHLASVVKVHDAQEELLKEFGVEGLRKNIGVKLADTSKQVEEILEKGRKAQGNIDEMDKKIQELTKKLDKLLKSK